MSCTHASPIINLRRFGMFRIQRYRSITKIVRVIKYHTFCPGDLTALRRFQRRRRLQVSIKFSRQILREISQVDYVTIINFFF